MDFVFHLAMALLELRVFTFIRFTGKLVTDVLNARYLHRFISSGLLFGRASCMRVQRGVN